MGRQEGEADTKASIAQRAREKLLSFQLGEELDVRGVCRVANFLPDSSLRLNDNPIVSVIRPNARRDELHEMIVRITKINAAASPLPLRFAFDYNVCTPQPAAPRLVLGCRDRERHVQRPAPIMWRDESARRNRLRSQGTATREEQEDPASSGIERLIPMAITLHHGQPEDIAIERSRTLQVVGIEYALNHSMD